MKCQNHILNFEWINAQTDVQAQSNMPVQLFYIFIINKGMSYCYAIHESLTGLKETTLPQHTHGIDDHGMCMTNLPVHFIYHKKKCFNL